MPTPERFLSFAAPGGEDSLRLEKPEPVVQDQKAPAECVLAAPPGGVRGLQVSHCCLLLSRQLVSWQEAGKLAFVFMYLQLPVGVVCCR